MRILLCGLAMASLAAPALAAGMADKRLPRERSVGVQRIDCPRPVIQHAQGPAVSGPMRLAALPPAWRLHAVNRTLDGCAIAPEATRVNDGGLAERRATPRR